MEDFSPKRKEKPKKQTLKQTQLEAIIEVQKRFFVEDENNFIDYFIEIGVKPEIFKNKLLYESEDIEDINQNLIPQIISKFPTFDKKNVVIESPIIHQIFPHGFKLLVSDKKPIPNFYCLILDNQLYSAIYTRKYLSCLIIYESIEDYKKMYDKYQEKDEKFLCLMKDMVSKKSSDISENENTFKHYYIPKCLCFVSVYPYINKYEEILRTIYNLTLDKQYSYLFIDQIIEKLIIETPKIPRGLKRIILKFPNQEIELTENKMNELCQVNVNLEYTFEILNFLNIIEIYKYLLYETKLIFFSENLYKLTNTILSFIFLLSPFNYQFQIVSILSKELYHFMETISPFIFGVNEKFEDNFFIKHKISIDDTTICIIDIDNDKHFLIAPGGIVNPKDFPEIPKKLRKKLEDKIKKYIEPKKKKNSIDNYIIAKNYGTNNTNVKFYFNENIQRSTTSKNVTLNNILTGYNEELNRTNALSEILTPNFNNNDNYTNNNKEIQRIFSRFMINLLKDYPKYLTNDYSVNRDISQSIKDLIDLDAYVNSYSDGDKNFYSKIFSTQMFMEFIYKRMMPKDCNEKVDVLFIEEKINEKINEKNIFSKISKSKNACQYILLNCQLYNYDNEPIIIDLTAPNGMPQALKEYILNNTNLYNSFLRRGYDISINDESKISFTYNIFPTILSDTLFLLNYKEYKFNEYTFNKRLEDINTKIVNKSALKFIKEKSSLKNSENDNDLYLCYIIVWSLAFWYMEEQEKDYRFIRMLDILERVEEHDVKIFEILLKTLVEHSKDENVILLYKKFIHLRLNPSWEMFRLVSKIIKKKQNAGKKKSLLQQDTKIEKLREKYNRENNFQTEEKFSRRVFKIQNKDDYIFSNKILFYAYFICKKCGGIVNIGKFCSDLKTLKMEKDSYKLDRIKCNNKNKEGKICNNLCDQNFRYRFGEELFNQKILVNQNFRYFTSVPSSIVLLSPKEIKNHLLMLSMNQNKEDNFDIENFRINFPDLFWSLIWYFDLNNLDKSFILPYENSLKIENPITTKNNVIYYENKNSAKESNENDINKNNKVNIIRINAKNSNKINIFKNRNKKKIKKYNNEDLCIQNVFELAIFENIGMISYKNLYSYDQNISYNEYPIFPNDKDNYSIYGGSYLYNINESEISTRASLLRDSILSYQTLKRNSLDPANTKKKVSKSGPQICDIVLKLGTRDSIFKNILFDENEDFE